MRLSWPHSKAAIVSKVAPDQATGDGSSITHPYFNLFTSALEVPAKFSDPVKLIWNFP